MLFTKLIAMIFTFNLSINSNKPALKNRYNMNDINEFCDNFVRIVYFSMIWFMKMSVMLWFSTNNDIQLMIQLGIFFFRRLWINLTWFTVGKALATWKGSIRCCESFLKFSFQMFYNHDVVLNMHNHWVLNTNAFYHNAILQKCCWN